MAKQRKSRGRSAGARAPAAARSNREAAGTVANRSSAEPAAAPRDVATQQGHETAKPPGSGVARESEAKARDRRASAPSAAPPPPVEDDDEDDWLERTFDWFFVILGACGLFFVYRLLPHALQMANEARTSADSAVLWYGIAAATGFFGLLFLVETLRRGLRIGIRWRKARARRAISGR